MKGMHLNDAFVAVTKAASPERWSRYCDLANTLTEADSAEKERAGRAMLVGQRSLSAAKALRLALTDDPELRDMLDEAAYLKQSFLNMFLEAMRSNKVSVIGLDPDDLKRPVRISADLINLALDGRYREEPDAKLDWDASAIEVEHRRLVWVRVTINQAADSQRGGRPAVADWDVIEELLRQEIKTKKRGLPSRDNEKGWQTIEDACRWVAEVLEKRRETAGWSTIRRHVKAMLKRMQSVTET